MEAVLDGIAAGADPYAKPAQYRKALAACLAGGGDVVGGLTEIVRHLVDCSDGHLTCLAAQVYRVAQESRRVPAGFNRSVWTIARCTASVGLGGGRSVDRSVSRRKEQVGQVELADLENDPKIAEILSLQAGGSAAAAAGAGAGAGAGARADADEEDAEVGSASTEPSLSRAS
jgi:hypothetical protein